MASSFGLTPKPYLQARPEVCGSDSGSLVVDKGSKKAIGLLMGGSLLMTCVNPINLVLSELGDGKLI
jgi:hypothetical protein